MKVSGNQVLITGGATGIGLSIAAVLAREGNQVAVCGRRREKLSEAEKVVPGLITRACDVSDSSARRSLLEWATSALPRLNVLVNNAGIQRVIDFRRGTRDLETAEEEIAINLRSPIQLTGLFLPQLLKQTEAAVVNMSSGLGFAPIASMPVYCATKAALHSLSLSLRRQLRDTPVKVFEVIPPTVDTELPGPRRYEGGRAQRSIQPEEVAEATLRALRDDRFEVAIGQAEHLREGRDRLFEAMNP
jgi:uncharacterized oxidoreductase